jgi:hypothetical protein
MAKQFSSHQWKKDPCAYKFLSGGQPRWCSETAAPYFENTFMRNHLNSPRVLFQITKGFSRGGWVLSGTGFLTVEECPRELHRRRVAAGVTHGGFCFRYSRHYYRMGEHQQ